MTGFSATTTQSQVVSILSGGHRGSVRTRMSCLSQHPKRRSAGHQTLCLVHLQQGPGSAAVFIQLTSFWLRPPEHLRGAITDPSPGSALDHPRVIQSQQEVCAVCLLVLPSLHHTAAPATCQCKHFDFFLEVTLITVVVSNKKEVASHRLCISRLGHQSRHV